MRFLLLLLVFICVAAAGLWMLRSSSYAMEKGPDLMNKRPEGYPVATFAGGCFWCLESEFRALDGVLFTEPGYTGGHVDNPAYRQVTTGETGHAEAVQVIYDPEKISYEALVEFFFTKAHDPTQIDRQGVDVGPQYRSGIFYHDETQRQAAEAIKERLTRKNAFKKPIATEITAFEKWWPAEEYHQQYYEKYEEETGQPHIRVLLKKKKK